MSADEQLKTEPDLMLSDEWQELSEAHPELRAGCEAIDALICCGETGNQIALLHDFFHRIADRRVMRPGNNRAFDELIIRLLDFEQLVEHGTSQVYSWLTARGEAAKAALDAMVESWDDEEVDDEPPKIVTDVELTRFEDLEREASPGGWCAGQMVNDRGELLTEEELVDYFRGCVRVGQEKGFAFVSVEQANGRADVCHAGNGPTSEANSLLIATMRNNWLRLITNLRAERMLRGQAEEELATLRLDVQRGKVG